MKMGFYDFAANSAAKKNIAAQPPEIVKHLSALLLAPSAFLHAADVLVSKQPNN